MKSIHRYIIMIGLTLLSITAFAQAKQVVINGTNVRMRFEPNLNCKWLCYNTGSPVYLPKGTKVKYVGNAGNFYAISYQGQTLYVSKDYSYIYGTTPPARQSQSRNMGRSEVQLQNTTVVINGVHVRLRVGPGTNYNYFTWDDGSPCYLEKGTRLPCTGEENGFYRATYRGRTVYISKKFSYVIK